MLPNGPRRPQKAALSGTPGDRRLKRLQPPACSVCGQDDTVVTLRTDYVLYLRCDRCGSVWSVPKPGHDQFVT